MGTNKIETVDCVVAITKYFFDKETDNYPLLRNNLWKRLSKTGSGDNVVRMFQNKETGTVVKVLSTETKIYKISEVPSGNTTLRKYLKDILTNHPEEFYSMQYDIFGEDNVVNWPQINPIDFLKEPGVNPDDYPDYDITDTETEPLDMENFEWISLTDTDLVIACGGDWQEPLTLTIRLINGQLTVINVSKGFAEGLSERRTHENIKSGIIWWIQI